MIYFWIILGIFNPLTLLVLFIVYAKTTGFLNKIVTVLGAIVDLGVNVTWFTVLFWAWPKELLLTQRVSRLKTTIGYRGWFAASICSLLNYFQKGHCK